MLKQFFKKKQTINYQYAILEHTPFLHDAEQLWLMYRNATNDFQKAAIFNHILNFNKHTMHLKSYRRLYNKIYDEYSQ